MWTFWIMSIFSGICCFSTFWTLYSPENIRQTCFWKINLLTKGWGCVWEIRKGEVKTWNLLSHISVSEGGKCSLQLLLCTLCKCSLQVLLCNCYSVNVNCDKQKRVRGSLFAVRPSWMMAMMTVMKMRKLSVKTMSLSMNVTTIQKSDLSGEF